MMNYKFMKLAGKLLDAASEQYSNHSCNDIDRKMIDSLGLTDEEKLRFLTEFWEWNGDPEHPEITVENFYYLQDWMVMRFLAHCLEVNALSTEIEQQTELYREP